ncbi:MAG: SIMPL domain-containing protein [Bifidobacteriaceae bacterium]|jgi:uncharacterized protein YggE|nr:SIMPL domain-containing protein [Bifidobacteriaceae bacterium]
MTDRTITVKGIGRVTTAPDLIAMTFDISDTEPEYDQAMETITLRAASLRAAITAAGLPASELKTVRLGVDTKFESYDSDISYGERFVGYTCGHRMSLEFPLDMRTLSYVIAAISSTDANPEFGIRFTVKDPDAVAEKLLAEAMADATVKAQTLARAARLKLGPIQQIRHSWGELHLYSRSGARLSPAVMAIPSPPPAIDMEPEDIHAEDTVEVVWSIGT